MDAAGIYQMSALFFIEAVQIRNVLEIVGVKFTAFYYFIGQNIIVKFRYFQIIAQLLQERLCLCQNFCMGSCGGGYGDSSILISKSGGTKGTQYKKSGQCGCSKFFHNHFLHF